MSTFDDTPAVAPSPRYRSYSYWRDFFERVGWTLVQVALSLVAVDSLDLPVWVAAAIAPALAALKAAVARKVGETGTASTAPGV